MIYLSDLDLYMDPDLDLDPSSQSTIYLHDRDPSGTLVLVQELRQAMDVP